MPDVVVLNQGFESRTTGTGRQYMSFSVKSEPLIFDFDSKALGRKPAEAIAEFFRSRIGMIQERVKPATLKARRSARAAFDHVVKQRETAKAASAARKASAASKPRESKPAKFSHPKQQFGDKFGPKKPARSSTATGESERRYSGGKLGPMPPNADNAGRMFNDSGRLAKSIVAGPSDDGWIVNVAANRFDPQTLDNGGASALQSILSKLISLIPEFGDPSLLMSSIPVRKAMNDAIGGMITKASARNRELRIEEAKSIIGIAKQILSLVA